MKNALLQLKYFFQDYKKISGSKKVRMLYLWMNRQTVGIFLYRFERFLFLLLGKSYQIIRILFLPIYLPLYAYSNCDINYKANIGPGISVLHPSMGIVISGFATIGSNMTLVGGNVIGGKPDVRSEKKFIIGNNLNMGANSVILGPVELGNNINVGASALVNKNFESDSILVGIPAKKIDKEI